MTNYQIFHTFQWNTDLGITLAFYGISNCQITTCDRNFTEIENTIHKLVIQVKTEAQFL